MGWMAVKKWGVWHISAVDAIVTTLLAGLLHHKSQINGWMRLAFASVHISGVHLRITIVAPIYQTDFAQS